MNNIWKFDMKEKNWKECNIKIPIIINGAAAVVNESDSSIHIIGGANGSGVRDRVDTHYVLYIVEQYIF